MSERLGVRPQSGTRRFESGCGLGWLVAQRKEQPPPKRQAPVRVRPGQPLDVSRYGERNGSYVYRVITTVLGAPGSGKTMAARLLPPLLPGHVVLDWDAFMTPAAALAGRDISQHPATWPAYRQLIGAVVDTVAHLPVVLLGVSTPDELRDWPIAAWVLLDCADEERERRLSPGYDREQLAEALADARKYRALGLPVIDATSQALAVVAAELARFVLAREQGDVSAH